MNASRCVATAVLACVATLASAWAVDPSLPYEEDWGDIAVGNTAIGINGWYGDANHCYVTNISYSWSGDRPIPGSSSNVLTFDTENQIITNVLNNAGSNTHETADFMLQFVASEDEDARAVITNDTSVYSAYYLNTNGRLVVYGAFFDGVYNFTNGFWTLEDVVDPVQSGEWARVTIEFDFVTQYDEFGLTFFRISLNGTTYSNAVAFADPAAFPDELVDPDAYVGTWFVAANWPSTLNQKLSSVSIQGTGRIDDYVIKSGLLGEVEMHTIMVSVNDSLRGKYWSAQSGGVELPASFEVEQGASTSLWLIAEAYWDTDSITTNGHSIGTVNLKTNEIVLANVSEDITVYADLIAETTQVATGTNVPNWWLAKYFGDTNDFSSHITYDDGDGMQAWQEYFAGTIPTNAASFFAATSLSNNTGNGNWTIKWYCDDVDPELPDYIVQRATNLLDASPWTNLAPSVARALGELTYTDENPPANGRAFYRIVVPIPAE